MERLIVLWKVLLLELQEMCLMYVTSDDLNMAVARSESEGDSFFTITLPTFCKDFERSLEEGGISLDLFVGFRKQACLPIFLQGFMAQIFERGTGRLLAQPDIDCIFAIRQLTAAFGKIEGPRTKAQDSFRD